MNDTIKQNCVEPTPGPAWHRIALPPLAFFLVGLLVASASAADPEIDALRQRVSQLERDVQELKAKLNASAVRQPAPPDIRVLPGDWGSAGEADIRAVCKSAASELFKHVADVPGEPISIRRDDKGPMVIYGVGPSGERRVLLNTKDTYWSQYAYQFSHECCHILCNYRDGQKENLWFEEALCETASLFALRAMAASWQATPPYPNWKSYSDSLAKYAQERIDAADNVQAKTLAAWLREHEAALRKNPTDRAKNQVVAVRLLPLLEKNPQHWQAVRFLNQSPAEKSLTFQEYLQDWHKRTPAEHQPFVADIAALFEAPLEK
jgi:hypothetical protein